ncbi:MAG TPA: ATP-binding protein [Pyrinomonadaceae bacterium]|nr:ATP-binding protein [Pyrinomonadaceae bacterium]
MSLLEALQLIGYSLGAVLPLWLGYVLLRQRVGLVTVERLLLVLAGCMVGWHGGNLIVTLRSLLGLPHADWIIPLRVANTIAVISITLCYSVLLHVHLHLWAGAHGRSLNRIERIRAVLSYLPCIFLVLAIPRIWSGEYQPMIAKTSSFVLPFALWVVYSLSVCAITELLVARRADSASERRILRTLAFSFFGIAVLILSALGLGMGRGTTAGLYLQTFANLGSLLPSALLAYYIYRYRFLELIIKESLVVASFAAVVLAVYVYGIRRIGEWTNARYGVRAGVIEAILILGLTFLAAPMRGALERWFRSLFERETALYRDVMTGVGAQVGQFRELPELISFIETQIASALPLRKVKIVLSSRESTAVSPSPHAERGAGGEEVRPADPTPNFSPQAERGDEDKAFFSSYPLLREDQTIGALRVEASPGALTSDVRAVLEVLAGQIAVALDDWRLVEENVRLERKLAEGERLAALGQMAATVAHEVKNPLSAIKSIAQVMSEDEALKTQHARDLSLIVGETDRLNNTVTQLLSFARTQTPASAPSSAAEIVGTVVSLFRAEAEEKGVTLRSVARCDGKLDGVQTSAVRDALSNLLLNGLQATPRGGMVKVECDIDAQSLLFTVSDTGPGIPEAMREKVWQPFFTTRQRGTGLGLAIVRKRMQEAGGSALLAPSSNGEGARFELRVSLSEA